MEGKTGKVGFNHTIERRINGKFTDYPNWKVYINDKTKVLAMRPKGPCAMDMPMLIKLEFLSFPENDSRDQCWTWVGSMSGSEFIVIASLDPHLKDELYEKEL